MQLRNIKLIKGKDEKEVSCSSYPQLIEIISQKNGNCPLEDISIIKPKINVHFSLLILMNNSKPSLELLFHLIKSTIADTPLKNLLKSSPSSNKFNNSFQQRIQSCTHFIFCISIKN